MNRYSQLRQELPLQPRRWLVTGAAGFVGSHLLASLLKAKQTVVGVDNFLTGARENLEAVRQEIGDVDWSRFQFLEGDLRDPSVCREACESAEVVLHQAALGSIPRSIARPADTHANNVDGFLNLLLAARDAGVKAFVFASSSSVYGDHPVQPRREEAIGHPLSPYALSKQINEFYAALFARCYGMSSIGLRYFNVFGARQNVNGPYAAVIPQWITAMAQGRTVRINGDGNTSRDFTYVENVVQANWLAADWLVRNHPAPEARIFNVATGTRISLNELFALLRSELSVHFPALAGMHPEYGPFRAGDVRHSQADIRQIQEILDYCPTHNLPLGLKESLAWYLANSPISGSQTPQCATQRE